MCEQSENCNYYPTILTAGTLLRLTDTSQHSDGIVGTEITFLPS